MAVRYERCQVVAPIVSQYLMKQRMSYAMDGLGLARIKLFDVLKRRVTANEDAGRIEPTKDEGFFCMRSE